MTLRCPDLFFDFKCTCNSCTDNCCRIGWDIEIDEDTLNYYKAMDNDLGHRLCENIYEEDGCYYMSQPNGCPFLTDDGLCSVQQACGAEHISDICREHPRFYEWFGDYKEAGLGLCCEEVSRMLLTHERPILFTEKQTDEAPDDLEYNKELCAAVKMIRDRLIDIAQDRGFDILQRLTLLLYSAEDIGEAVFDEDCERLKKLSGMLAIDGFRMEIIIQSQKDSHSDKAEALGRLCGTFSRMGYMGELGKRFDISSELAEKMLESESDLIKQYSGLEYELENVLVYFLYRYFIKSARDLSGEERLYSAVICTLAVRTLLLRAFTENGSLPTLEERIVLVKEFSKEVEYDSDNMDIIYEEIQEGRLDRDTLCGLSC